MQTAIEAVFECLTTKSGIESFWAERAIIKENYVMFEFPNGMNYTSKIYEISYPTDFQLDYFKSKLHIQLFRADKGGTILSLLNDQVADPEFAEVSAGWVSVLMNLKAVLDYNCDLRNHDGEKTWDQGFINN